MKRVAEAVTTTELCSYGCGNIAQYKNGSGKLMCCDRHNKCPALRKKNSDGLSQAHKDGRAVGWSKQREEYGTNTGWSKGLTAAEDSRIRSVYKADDIFTLNGKGPHKKLLIKERGHRCERCGLTEWLGVPITLELEHKDGNHYNNVKTNLELLCPNCHSQTPTWRRKKPTRAVTDVELTNALVSSDMNIKKALEMLCLRIGGANYNRCYKLMKEITPP